MSDPARLLYDPAVFFTLRVAFGGYVIYMARKFYIDPTGYFRKSARNVDDLRFLEPIIRGLACFCLWGGCFIIATAVAVQVFGLHGDLLALALVAIAALGAWFLLPGQAAPDSIDRSNV